MDGWRSKAARAIARLLLSSLLLSMWAPGGESCSSRERSKDPPTSRGTSRTQQRPECLRPSTRPEIGSRRPRVI